MQYLGQGLIMIISGIAAGFVADLIKKKMIITQNKQKIPVKICNSIEEGKSEIRKISKILELSL